ncbi:MAG: cation acetate symporter [Actinobacteria bacterium]|nr:cation acetate symporter [Actinomycetota bacterium]
MSDIQVWTLIWVIVTFSLYLFIAWRSRVADTEGFYVAGHGVPAVANGAAVAADWMSAASFISMAGLIAFQGYGGSVYLMGWTGGYVLLALLLAPYLRKFGKYTVPDFVGDRYSETARAVAAIAAIFVSLTYVAGQMRGVGIVFSRYVGIEIFGDAVIGGVLIGMAVVFFYAVLGGMKGITWTQVAQYSVLIIAYLIPAIAIAYTLSGNPIPQLSFGGIARDLNELQRELGFSGYTTPFTDPSRNMLNMLLITGSLMIGTAGLPHVIVRFYTTKTVRDARASAFWALLFIGILYTTAPAVGVFAKTNFIQDVNGASLNSLPQWVVDWQDAGLITIEDKNGDGQVQFAPGEASDPDSANEITPDLDIMVLATPQIAGLPAIVVGLVAAGGLAAALSTASGLLLVIASSVAHDFYYKRFRRDATEAQQLRAGRIAMACAIVVAGWFGINPPAFVGQVVAFAFGLAAASFFPIIVLGIFWKRANAKGAVAGMATGLIFTGAYILATVPDEAGAIFFGLDPFLGISPEGIGTIGAILNFTVTIVVSRMTAPPPQKMMDVIEEVRYPDPGSATTTQAH